MAIALADVNGVALHIDSEHGRKSLLRDHDLDHIDEEALIVKRRRLTSRLALALAGLTTQHAREREQHQGAL